jgi:hypothetical protein
MPQDRVHWQLLYTDKKPLVFIKSKGYRHQLRDSQYMYFLISSSSSLEAVLVAGYILT